MRELETRIVDIDVDDINLSILDFKLLRFNIIIYLICSINISILDFK